MKEPKGAKKPIKSYEFRDRFQVDLIDMRKRKRKNIYGVVQRWILTPKDHATGLTYIRSLPRKKAKYVAHELDFIFGFIGCPHIFHTDNGKEFVAKEVLTLLKDLNPHISAVTGRPRTPRDQGSVEVMNKLVKKTLMMIESDEMDNNGVKDPNWTNYLGRVMSVINDQCGRGKYAETAYKAAFGMDYDLPIRSKCDTIEERLRDNQDPRLEFVAKELCLIEGEVPQDFADDQESYWDKDDMSLCSNDDTSVKENINGDIGDTETRLAVKSDAAEDVSVSAKVATKDQTIKKSNSIIPKELRSELPKADKMNGFQFRKMRKLYTVSVAWQQEKAVKSISKGARSNRQSPFLKEYKFVYNVETLSQGLKELSVFYTMSIITQLLKLIFSTVRLYCMMDSGDL